MTESLESTQQRGSLRRIVLKNTAVVMLGSAILKAINFIFSVYIVRQLGDERFGQYSVVLAFVGLFQIFAELGVGQYAMREIAQDREKTRPIFWNLMAVRLILAGFGVVGITLAAVGFGYEPRLILGVFIFTTTFLLMAVQAPLQTVLTAWERFDLVTAMNILGQVSFVFFGAIFLFSGMNYIWLIVASLLSIPPQILVGLWAVRKQRLLKGPVEFSPNTWPQLIRHGLPFGIIALTLTIAFSVDSLILKAHQPDYVVGWYRVAYNLVFSIMFITYAFKDAIVPSLSRTYVSDPTEVERWYYRTLRFITIISIPIAVGGMLTAYPIIRFLYTEEFSKSAAALQIIVWDVPFLMFSSFCGNITTIVRQEKAAARIYATIAIFNITGNLIVIPVYSYLGAAVMTVLTDLLSAIQLYFLLRHKLHLPKMGSFVLRVLFASTLMGLVISLAGKAHIFVLVGLGAIVYGAAIILLRVLDKREWSLIWRLLRLERKEMAAG